MHIAIMPATAAEAAALVEIQRKAFQRLYDIYHDAGSPYLRDETEIYQWLEKTQWHVYKIYADDILCGGAAFCAKDPSAGQYYFARIYILPQMQGHGIASSAILLCEKTVPNAKQWTLDYPAAEERNRRCYEKAGYHDTGMQRTQSDGAITLAYMEKII